MIDKNQYKGVFQIMSQTSKHVISQGSKGYCPTTPEIIKMTESLCSKKILKILKDSGAKYILAEKDSFKVIGRRRVAPYGGGTWEIARSDGSISQMENMNTGNPFLGLCFGFNEDGSNDYMVGIEYSDEVEGLESFEFPAHQWLIYALSGKVSEDVLGNAWWYVNNKLLSELGFEKDNLPTIESYIEWDNDADKCSIEICIPYTKK